MSDILADLSTPALVHAIIGNLLDYFRHFGDAAQTAFAADEKFTRWHTRLAHPWFNGVIATQPPAPEDEAFITDTMAYFRSCGVSPFTWWIAPAVPFALWEEVLCRHGFHVDRDTPGMAIELDHLPPDRVAPSKSQIISVENLDQLQTWTRVFIEGYELPLAWQTDLFDLVAGVGLDLPIRNYLGYLDGEPVATSTLFLGSGVAGVLCVATVPHARGRGLGAALTLAPLFEARALGYRAGILQSSALGYPIYLRLGFQKLCDMAHFYHATDFDLEP
jgi:GNAT superfamily N-acetyltransferase